MESERFAAAYHGPGAGVSCAWSNGETALLDAVFGYRPDEGTAKRQALLKKHSLYVEESQLHPPTPLVYWRTLQEFTDPVFRCIQQRHMYFNEIDKLLEQRDFLLKGQPDHVSAVMAELASVLSQPTLRAAMTAAVAPLRSEKSPGAPLISDLLRWLLHITQPGAAETHFLDYQRALIRFSQRLQIE